MLRIHCVQLIYNLSDPAMEDTLYDGEEVRRFVGLRIEEALPDETAILNFRHLLEQHNLGTALFAEGTAQLACACGTEPSSMPRSSRRRNRRGTARGDATPRCIRRGRASNGTSA